MIDTTGSIFEPTAHNRALRALIIGLFLGGLAGLIAGGLAVTRE